MQRGRCPNLAKLLGTKFLLYKLYEIPIIEMTVLLSSIRLWQCFERCTTFHMNIIDSCLSDYTCPSIYKVEWFVNWKLKTVSLPIVASQCNLWLNSTFSKRHLVLQTYGANWVAGQHCSRILRLIQIWPLDIQQSTISWHNSALRDPLLRNWGKTSILHLDSSIIQIFLVHRIEVTN